MKSKVLSILFICFSVPFLLCANLYGHEAELTDLVEKLIPAVVNISSEVIVRQDNNRVRTIIIPRGDVFDEFRRIFDHLDQFFIDKAPKEIIFRGSGFIIDESGVIVTSHHVIKDAKEITVTMNDSSYFKAEILGYDLDTDIAVLKIHSDKPLPYVQFDDSENARVGDTAIAIGNPFGLGSSVSKGIISSRARGLNMGNISELIQTDTTMNIGNSGGPLFNVKGGVIGINNMGITTYSGGSIGVNFAIPSNSVVSIIEALKTGKKVEHGWIGVFAVPITTDIADTLCLKDTKGALITNVVKDSPAERGGIKVGDVLLEFDGKKIDRSTQLTQIVSSSEPNKKVRVKLLRKCKEVNIKITIGESNKAQENDKLKLENVTGIAVSDLPSNLKVTEKGVIVVNVDDNSDSARYLKKGDIILQVNNVDVANIHDFQEQINLAVNKHKRAVLLLVYRDGVQALFLIRLQK